MAAATATDVSDDEAVELLVELVETSSPSDEEAAAAEVLADFFEAHGREVWIDEVGNVRAPADDGVLLTSHVDTVPGEIPVRVEEDPDDEVLEHLVEASSGSTDGDADDGSDGTSGDDVGASDDGPDLDDHRVLWGRGSVDATGPLAAMAAAAVRTGASFVGVTGEETDSRGARHLVEDRESAPGAVINGEPSGWNGVTLGYRGFLAGTYVATSESGHTSRPEPNAIEHALEWWGDVREAVADVGGDEYDPVFEQVTAKPVDVEGGTSADGLSVEATMDVQLRIPPATDADTLRELADAQLELGTVHWAEPIPPVMEHPRTPVARALRGAIRRTGGDPRLLRKTGTSDMNVFAKAWDCPMATYGPGDSDLDHSPQERLPLAEFERSIAALADACESLLASGSESSGTDDRPDGGERSGVPASEASGGSADERSESAGGSRSTSGERSESDGGDGS